MHNLSIKWNDGNDAILTDISSSEPILSDYFRLENWNEVHDMSKAVATHTRFDGANRGFSFVKQNEKPFVDIYTDEGSVLVEEYFFIEKSLYLFELLIAGANEHHHTIRYETWWHAFTNYMFQIQEQIAT